MPPTTMMSSTTSRVSVRRFFFSSRSSASIGFCGSPPGSAAPARPALVELDAAIRKSGVDGGLNQNIVQDLWDKWIMLCSLAATNCLMRGSSGDILEADEGMAIVMETVDEGQKVAAAAGHDDGDYYPDDASYDDLRDGFSHKRLSVKSLRGRYAQRCLALGMYHSCGKQECYTADKPGQGYRDLLRCHTT